VALRRENTGQAWNLFLSLSFRLELIPPRGGVSHADPPSPLVSIISVFLGSELVYLEYFHPGLVWEHL